MKVVGIMGGTFNPIHLGHIAIAKAAREQFNIPEILIMPSFSPAYKDTLCIVSPQHRINMINLAIKDYDYMHISTIETDRGGKTYTADTLAEIKEDYDLIYFIIGGDSLFALQNWYKPDYICKHCHLLAANRDNHNSAELIKQKAFLEDTYGAHIDFIKCDDYPFSSTLIRDCIKQCKSIKKYVGEDVADYIISNKLYID